MDVKRLKEIADRMIMNETAELRSKAANTLHMLLMEEPDTLPTDIIGTVNQWNLDAGRTQGYFNPRQAAFYLGMQCEELAEKLAACGLETNAEILDHLGKELKQGTWDAQVMQADRKTMLDGDADLVVVTIGSAQGIGSDFQRAMDKVLAANEAKRFADGQLHKDANGKILKPEGWQPPDLTDCLEG